MNKVCYGVMISIIVLICGCSEDLLNQLFDTYPVIHNVSFDNNSKIVHIDYTISGSNIVGADNKIDSYYTLFGDTQKYPVTFIRTSMDKSSNYYINKFGENDSLPNGAQLYITITLIVYYTVSNDVTPGGTDVSYTTIETWLWENGQIKRISQKHK